MKCLMLIVVMFVCSTSVSSVENLIHLKQLLLSLKDNLNMEPFYGESFHKFLNYVFNYTNLVICSIQ
jgi:hypothetical protein